MQGWVIPTQHERQNDREGGLREPTFSTFVEVRRSAMRRFAGLEMLRAELTFCARSRHRSQAFRGR